MLSGMGLDEYTVEGEAIGRFLDRDGVIIGPWLHPSADQPPLSGPGGMLV